MGRQAGVESGNLAIIMNEDNPKAAKFCDTIKYGTDAPTIRIEKMMLAGS